MNEKLSKLSNTQRKRLLRLEKQARPVGRPGIYPVLFGQLMQRHEILKGVESVGVTVEPGAAIFINEPRIDPVIEAGQGQQPSDAMQDHLGIDYLSQR